MSCDPSGGVGLARLGGLAASSPLRANPLQQRAGRFVVPILRDELARECGFEDVLALGRHLLESKLQSFFLGRRCDECTVNQVDDRRMLTPRW